MTRRKKGSLSLALAALVLALATGCVAVPPPSITLPSSAPTTATAPAETTAPASALFPALGERVAVRPGVTATVSATTATVERLGTGVARGKGPRVPIVTVTIAYENAGAAPLDTVYTLELHAQTFDGDAARSIWVDQQADSHPLGIVMPGHTGTVAETYEIDPAWVGQSLLFTIPVPRLLNEQGSGGFPVRYATGTPTATS